MFGLHSLAGAALGGSAGLRSFIALQARRMTRYRASFTGAIDALTDLTLPISAFSFSNSSTGQAYLSVTVPGITLSGDIADRPNGRVKIWFVAENYDGTTQEMQFAEIAPSAINIYEGASSQSIVITGYQSIINASPIMHTLTDVTFRQDSGGVTRYRGEFNPNLMVGDWVTHRATTSKITQINGYASASQSVLEIAA